MTSPSARREAAEARVRGVDDSRPDRLALLALTLLTLAGALLRFTALGTKSLWYDEAAWYHLVQGSWREILAANAATNSAPPLFPLLVGLLTGPEATEAVLRAPAAVAGVLGIALVWRLACEFTTARAALVAALLVALSPIQVEYAQQLREYSAAFATACLVLLGCSRFMDRPTPGRALALAAAGALALGVQYGAALLIAALAAVTLVTCLRRAEWRPALGAWLLAHGLLALVALGLWRTTLATQLTDVAIGTAVYFPDRYWDGTLAGLGTLLFAGEADLVHFAYPGKLMFALTALGALAALLGRAPGRALVLLVAPAAVTLAAALAGLYPFGGIRQDMMLLPMIYVGAALGVAAGARALGERAGSRLAAPVVAGVATAVVAALAWGGAMRTWTLLHSPGSEPLRPVVAALAAQHGGGERIYVYSGAQPAFRYYWRTRPEPWIAGAVHLSGLDIELARTQFERVQRELAALVATGDPLWIVVSHMQPADRAAMLAALEASGSVAVVVDSGGAALYRVGGA